MSETKLVYLASTQSFYEIFTHIRLSFSNISPEYNTAWRVKMTWPESCEPYFSYMVFTQRSTWILKCPDFCTLRIVLYCIIETSPCPKFVFEIDETDPISWRICYSLVQKSRHFATLRYLNYTQKIFNFGDILAQHWRCCLILLASLWRQ